MHRFKELKVWQSARKLVKDVYILTRQFPKEEIYYLTSQIRRAAISVSSNIAEGCGRDSNKDFIRFVDIACGSLSELESQLILSYDLEYIAIEDLDLFSGKFEELHKMLFNFRKYLMTKLDI